MKATKKQLNYILTLLQKLPPEEVVKITREYDLQNLTKKQASNLIKKLLEVINHGTKRNNKTRNTSNCTCRKCRS
jgi:Cu/Ag efflux pump CusA